MRKEILVIFLITVVLFGLSFVIVSTASPEPIVSMDPSTSNSPIGVAFDINITVTDVTELYGWQFNVTFDPLVLNCTGFEQGPFLSQAGIPWSPDATIDNDAGYAFRGALLFPTPPNGASGNGTLATLTFVPLAANYTHLSFYESELIGWDHVNMMPKSIPNTAIDGFFSNIVDAAVIDVIPAADQAYPTWTIHLNITVTVSNNAPTPKNLTVTAYYENATAAYEIGTQNITNLSSGSQLNLTFNWNVTDVGWGIYTAKADVTLTGDINPANNEFTYSNVTIKIPGDAQGDPSDPDPTKADGDVDRYDYGALAMSYGLLKGQAGYNVECDYDRTDKIDRYDYGKLAWYYGTSTTKYP